MVCQPSLSMDLRVTSGWVWSLSWITPIWWDHSEAPEGLRTVSSGSSKITVADLGVWAEFLDELREWEMTSVDILGFGFSFTTGVSFDCSGSFVAVIEVGVSCGGSIGVVGEITLGSVWDEIAVAEGEGEIGVSIGGSCRLKIEFDTGDTFIKSFARSAYLAFFSVGLLGAAWKGDDLTCPLLGNVDRDSLGHSMGLVWSSTTSSVSLSSTSATSASSCDFDETRAGSVSSSSIEDRADSKEESERDDGGREFTMIFGTGRPNSSSSSFSTSSSPGGNAMFEVVGPCFPEALARLFPKIGPTPGSGSCPPSTSASFSLISQVHMSDEL